uniref:Mitochondrial processing peptidase beta subunit n=1 Tax=Panagrolaimus sp. JU765 TaxID=591449 RepID=A0AC34R569_9BILA
MNAFRCLNGIVRPVTQRPILKSLDRSIISVAKERLGDYPETRISTLPSGFRVATENSHIGTATVGVWIDAGSRYENEKNNGTAHFLEHMAFKGTKKRSQWQLELEVENMGAHLNAYTSREQTVYYAKCFSEDLEPAIELLSDILLHSVYGKDGIERERGVIKREAEEVAQNMQEVVFDELHMGAFRGTSLSYTILGSEKNINSLTRDDLVAYVQKYYKGPRMVLAAAGGVDHANVVSLAEKYFGVVEKGNEDVLYFEPGQFNESHQRIRNDEMDLVYGCLSVEGTSWTHPDNIALQVLNTMLGQFDRTQGTGLLAPSRLAERISHTSGVQHFFSFTTNYKDTGITGIYFIAEPNALQSLAEAVCGEWKALCDVVDETQLERAKRNLFTNMLIALDGSTSICEDIGRQLLCYGRRIPIAELEARIAAVTPDVIKKVARRYLVNQKSASVVIGQTDEWPNHEKLQQMLTY